MQIVVKIGMVKLWWFLMLAGRVKTLVMVVVLHAHRDSEAGGVGGSSCTQG